MDTSRAPYGRQQPPASFPLSRPSRGREPAYRGESYYGRPVVKRSHYGHLIAGYFFVGGLAGAAQLIAGVADLGGRQADRPIVRAGRYMALAGALVSPALLTADLHTPRRWYNMLRIFRRTSPMSVGAWTLAAFGALSGATAAAQALHDHTGAPGWRRTARLCGMPAALLGGVMATYTGTLLAATSNPLWAAGRRLLPALFATSAASTATAALTLATRHSACAASTARLERFALMTGGAELALAAALDRQWQGQGVAAPLRQQPTATAYRVGFHGLGVLAPFLMHSLNLLTRWRSQTMSVVASLATLVGGYVFRSVLITAGNTSAQRPVDYLQFTRPRGGSEPSAPSPPLATQCRTAVEILDRSLHASPRQIGREVDEVENIVARLRDAAIQQLRAAATAAEAAQWRGLLDQFNSALSLITGVEYPTSGIQRSSIEQARDILMHVLDTRLSAAHRSARPGSLL